MTYLCQPVLPDSWCHKCQRFTSNDSDDVFVALGSQDENCGYVSIDGSRKVIDLRPIVFKTYEERK